MVRYVESLEGDVVSFRVEVTRVQDVDAASSVDCGVL